MPNEELYPAETTKTYLRAMAGLPPLPAELPEAGPSIQSRWRDITKGVEEMSTTELAERAVGALGPGILKPFAAGRVLIGGSKAIPELSRYGTQEAYGSAPEYLWKWLRGILRAPQKELSRVRDIRAAAEGPKSTLGRYYHPPESSIELFTKHRPSEETIWHELAHARQYRPDPEEFIKAHQLRLRGLEEPHAYGFGRIMGELKDLPITQEGYNRIYMDLLEEALIR